MSANSVASTHGISTNYISTAETKLTSLPDEILMMIFEYLLPMKPYFTDGSDAALNLTTESRWSEPPPRFIQIDRTLHDTLRYEDQQTLQRLYEKANVTRRAPWEERKRQYMSSRMFHPEIMRVSRRFKKIANYILYERYTLQVLLSPGPRNLARLRMLNVSYAQEQWIIEREQRNPAMRNLRVWRFIFHFKKIRLAVTPSWSEFPNMEWNPTSIYRFISIAHPCFKDKNLTVVFEGLRWHWDFKEPDHAEDLLRAFMGLRCESVNFERGETRIGDAAINDAVQTIQGRTMASPDMFLVWSRLHDEGKLLYSSRVRTAKVWNTLSLMRQAVRYADGHSFSILYLEILGYFEERRRKVRAAQGGLLVPRVGKRELEALHRSTSPPTIRKTRPKR